MYSIITITSETGHLKFSHKECKTVLTVAVITLGVLKSIFWLMFFFAGSKNFLVCNFECKLQEFPFTLCTISESINGRSSRCKWASLTRLFKRPSLARFRNVIFSFKRLFLNTLFYHRMKTKTTKLILNF